jgi:hypothetical protein
MYEQRLPIAAGLVLDLVLKPCIQRITGLNAALNPLGARHSLAGFAIHNGGIQILLRLEE